MAAQESQENVSLTLNSDASSTAFTTIAPSTRQRMAQNYLLVWVDQNIDQTSKDCQDTLAQLRAVVSDVTICTQPDECIAFLDKHNDEKTFVITPGYLGQHLVPEIHGMPKLDAIYIFCGNISNHQQWTKGWNKIKGVHDNIKDICDAIKGGIKQVNQDSIPVSFVTANQLEPNYMYTQIFKDILLEMKHDYNQAINILAVYCYKCYPSNNNELNIVNEFKNNYRSEQAIWWYTRECFTYQMLNRALRTLDADIIINMGFFIRDLHEQLHQLHKQQLPNYHGKPFIVYRGQGLLKADFDKLKNTKGGLMSFNNFLSTSTKRDVSHQFAKGASGNRDMMGILFIMTIDPCVSSTPFASIKEASYFKEEEEILFSMHTVFRIDDIKQLDNNDRLYQVELHLTADDDEQLQRLTECISNEVAGGTGWQRLGNLLLKTGHFNKAEELYKVLFEQPLNESDKALYYNNLGTVKKNQGDYGQAIEYYKQGLEMYEKILPANHPSLATSYNNIGSVYDHLGEPSKALSFYETALGIWEKTLPADHPSLAISYNNIGSVYDNMGEYSKALSLYEKALEIQEKTLPENHPSLATSYNNIGTAYKNMGEYSKACSFYKKALENQEKTLPANHPSLAISYSNIGGVYAKMGEYSKTLSFYEKTNEIWEKTLPANHPSLATSYSNIGLVYENMGEYSKALLFYEKTLEIDEKTLPENHPSLAISYNNIGLVYDNMGEYSTALSWYEKALEIQEKTLPENHPHLAGSYSNLGNLYYNMAEYSKALSYFERALDIWQRALPPTHPQLNIVKGSIEIVKTKL
ncbi:unnamed protein product [Adineta steineri]|uniref:NAD(P)(+)--arginine ADP-ribosyltransferase n=1 Tax=Adineta steineri TaxID=433720 RepID=A0A813NLT9_9BILA|nr:unnamed protein product [Adineta steineri]CAF3798800.1 unnamed protein product [Adineta steineri]